MLNVVICDDHPIFREGLKTALSIVDDIAVVGEASSGPELLEVLARTPCNAILLDIALPGPDGIEVLKDLAYRDNRVPVLALSMYPEEHYALRAFRGGAAGYLTKNSPMPQLVEALRKVAGGGRYVSPAMAERLADEIQGGGKPGHEKLSDREYQVLLKLVSGKEIKEIAGELSISPSTIGTHRARILQKLGLRTRAELIRYAMEHQLVR
jgi:DNA-binding NarL/FixJ family response regulator